MFFEVRPGTTTPDTIEGNLDYFCVICACAVELKTSVTSFLPLFLYVFNTDAISKHIITVSCV